MKPILHISANRCAFAFASERLNRAADHILQTITQLCRGVHRFLQGGTDHGPERMSVPVSD
jgi:hypothetical protein